MIKVSDYIIKYVEDLGVKHIFTVSGGGIIHIINSLSKSKKIQCVCSLHEQGAGIAVEAYGQYTNNLGVALVTTGPGGTNIITAIAGAWLDSTPMLVIAGQVQLKDRAVNKGVRQMGFQEINLVSLIEKITKYAYTVIDAKSIKYHLDKAVFEAKHNRPGPVVLEIPLDMQSAYIDENELVSYNGVNLLNDVDIFMNEMVDLLKNAKKPILLAGNGIRLSGGIDAFYTFLAKTKIPVLTTWKALDLLEEIHPLFVGRPGAIAQRGANINQQNADLILCIGARLDHGQIAYQQKYFGRNAKKIIIDIDQDELNKFRFGEMENAITIQCDANHFLSMLNKQHFTLNTTEWLNVCKQIYNKYPVILPEYCRNYEYVNAYTFIGALSALLPENSLIIPGSSGTCSEVTMQALQIKKGTRVFNTEGLGSMGFGVPAAIGGCLAAGNKTTICIDGDGGFFMNIQELEVVHRLNLPIKYFVLNNQGYGSIRSTQKNHFNSNFFACDSKSGLTLPNIELTAKAYKIDYNKIKTNDDLLPLITDILSNDQPIICEIMIDVNHETLPHTVVYKNAEGKFETAPMEMLKPEI